MIIALTISAFLLRGPGIGSIPPGVWVDEAVEGLQAGTALSGEKLPPLPDPDIVYPRWPVWWLLECLSIKVGGMTTQALRAPAVVVGTLSVPLAWLVARSIWGQMGVLVAASFLAFSFWHIQISRIALAPVLLVAEALLVFGLVLAPAGRRLRLAGIGAGALVALACLDYPAAFALPIWAGLFAAVRVLWPGPEGKEGRRAGLWTAGGLLAGAAVLALFAGVFLEARMGRVNSVGLAGPYDMVLQALVVAANHLVPVKDATFYWDGFPPGGARFSPSENFAWLSGIAAVFALPGISAWKRAAMAAMLPVMLLPEVVPGTAKGLYLIRGVVSLSAMAVLAGAGSRLWAFSAGRVSLGVLVAVSAVSAWHASGMTYGLYAKSELVRRIYLGVASDLADGLRLQAGTGVIKVYPPLTYADNPQMAFILWDEIHAGRITSAQAPPAEEKVAGVYRDPVGGHPVVMLVVSRQFDQDRTVGMLDVQGSLMDGQHLESLGNRSEAERLYRMVSRFAPDYWEARVALGLVLLKQGKNAEGKRELMVAGRQRALPPEILEKLGGKKSPD